MTIENVRAYMDGVWDWGVLDGCFGATKIKPMDVDGLIERKGKFLMLEAKAPGVAVPQGQQILHEAWVKRGDSVLVVWGQKNQPERMQLFSPRHPFPDGMVYENADVRKFVEVVAAWFAWADTGNCPKVGR
jgi:hypothetical protein